MYYYDLIQNVLKSRNLLIEPSQVSAVLTQINLDTRFSYLGKGEWGLTAWVPSRSSRKLSSLSSLSKGLVENDDEADLDEEKEPLVEEGLDEESDEEVKGSDAFQEVSYKKPSHRSDEDSWN